MFCYYLIFTMQAWPMVYKTRVMYVIIATEQLYIHQSY